MQKDGTLFLNFRRVSMKKISIITPSFNQGQFIEQTIDSVLSQNYPHLEYIIMDGGSTDNSVEIIKKYEKHLTYWKSEKDKGQSDAINKGLKIASGDIINWLNSDDFYEPNALHTINHYFEEDNVFVLAGRSNILKANHIQVSGGTAIYETLEKTIGQARIDQPETFFRKSCIDQMGGLHPQFHFVMDKEWWIRYVLHFGLHSIKKTEAVLVNFRIHDQSKTSEHQVKFRAETYCLYYTLAKMHQLPEVSIFEDLYKVSFIENMHPIYKQHREIIQKSIHYFFFQEACIAYAQNNYEKAKKIMSLIRQEFLLPSDQKEWQKINFRMKLIPPFIKKIWNQHG